MKNKRVETLDNLNIEGICYEENFGYIRVYEKDKFSSTEYLLECALNEAERCGASTKHIRLVDYNILPCTGCGECMNGNKCKLLSNPTDQLKELYDECCKADAFIFASPVYALSLPAIWKCWFDRCEPCSESDLDYDYYCYDVVKQVKGKAFRGKVAAQIIVSAGSGAEWAISALAPAFTAVQLSIIASAGISLIEFDAQPGIKKHNWSKDISKAHFAINIAKSIGQRVAQTIGYSTYKIDATNRAKVIDETLILDQILENGCREKYALEVLSLIVYSLLHRRKKRPKTHIIYIVDCVRLFQIKLFKQCLIYL